MTSTTIPDNLTSPAYTSTNLDLALLRRKYRALQETLQSMGSVVVGFSGGPKSALLTKVAHDALGIAAVAAIVHFSDQDRAERDESMALAYAMGVQLVTIDAQPTAAGTASDVFEHMSGLAEKRGIHWIAYGDKHPEPITTEELPKLWPRTPLEEAGLTDAEIDALSHILGLTAVETETASAPHASTLGRADAAGVFLHELGFRKLTLHEHDTIARLEADPAEMNHLFDPDIRMQISKKLKSLGYTFVAVDLDSHAR